MFFGYKKRKLDVTADEQKEMRYWEVSPFESPKCDSMEYLLYKIGDAMVFWEKVCQYRQLFESAERIIEIGAGQCYASCVVKRAWPLKTLVATDLAKSAIEAAPRWEQVFAVELNGKYVCRSHQIPVRDESMDLAFCFQSAHHFIHHRRTLMELKRVLRPGGNALYLHEPGCQRWSHGLAWYHMSRKRPEVPEDALVYSRILSLAKEAGFQSKVIFAPTATHKKPMEALYHSTLKRVNLLRRILPCIVDFVCTKPLTD